MWSYKMTKGEAIDLQDWVIERSGARNFLKSLPEGLYVDYSIDEDELDDGLDWPEIIIASVYTILNNKKILLGDISAYNFERYWFSTRKFDEVDTIENWIELIKEDYKKLIINLEKKELKK